jgi:hypothetical protein
MVGFVAGHFLAIAFAVLEPEDGPFLVLSANFQRNFAVLSSVIESFIQLRGRVPNSPAVQICVQISD